MLRLALFSSISLFIFAALAQQTDVQTDTPKVLKKIVVTGSYIRRAADEEAPSPVTVIDNTKAQEAGSFSASGALKDNALISGASTSNSGSTNVSFHGQGSANNLVLLNGLRLPKPAGGESVNIDFIPASAIERIEVLKDGASALYGSEALAGVVNIVTKKEYDGTNVTLRQTTPEEGIGQESNVVATYGKNFSKGNLLAVFQFRKNTAAMFRDTEYGITDVKRAGSLTSFPGNLQNIATTTYHRAADCPPEQVGTNGACRYDYYNSLPLNNERDYYNLLVSGGYDLPNKLRIEGSVLLAHQRTMAVNTPKIINLEDLSSSGGQNYSVDGATANANFSPLLSGNPVFNPGDKLKLLYSADEELGIERSEQVLNNGTAQLKIGRESENFDWDFSLGYGVSAYREDVVDGNARMDILHSKLLNGSWNPFRPAGSGTKGDLSDAMVDTWNSNFADIWNARLIASGRVFDFGAKSIFAAYGIEGQKQKYSFRADSLSLQNLPLTGLFSNQDGDRDVRSFFLELSQNPIPRLQLQAAIRMDRYSDFGGTINPKLAAGYKITDQLSFRGSFGTGFKAPDLRSLYQGNVTRPQRFRDDVICSSLGNNDPNCNNLFSTTTRGDASLDAEEGEHWNLGFQMRPKKNWTIAVDHWRATGTQALSNIDLSRLTAAERQFGAGVLSSLGVTIQRDSNNIIQYVLLPLKTNSGRYDTNGVDIDIKHTGMMRTRALGTLNYSLRMDHSHTISSGTQPFYFFKYEKQLDLNWRNVASMTLSKGAHLASLRARTFSARDKDETRSNTSSGKGSIPVYSEYDVHYEYYGAWQGIITAGVRNVFDRKVYNELSRGGPGFLLPGSETLLGRTFYLGYSQDF